MRTTDVGDPFLGVAILAPQARRALAACALLLSCALGACARFSPLSPWPNDPRGGDPAAGLRIEQEARSGALEAVTIPAGTYAHVAATTVFLRDVAVRTVLDGQGKSVTGPVAFLAVQDGPQGFVHVGQVIGIASKAFMVAYIHAPASPGAVRSVTLFEVPASGGPDAPAPMPPVIPRSPPANEYGALSGDDCETQLGSRHIPFTRVTKGAAGVVHPIRLSGPLNGVTLSSAGSVYDTLDCRLALALDDFTRILAAHGVVRYHHLSLYRPGAVIARSRRSSQHAEGLAVDIAEFTLADGTHLNVLHDWVGAIGLPVCGPGSTPKPDTPSSAILRAIVCEAHEQQLFNVMLTPNANADHHNHFHLDLSPEGGYFVLD